MAILDFHRYFLVDNTGPFHRALSDLEDAGAHVLDGCRSIQEHELIPVVLTLTQQQAGMTALPQTMYSFFPQIAKDIRTAYAQIKSGITGLSARVAIIIPPPTIKSGFLPISIKHDPIEIGDILMQLHVNLRKLNPSPNFLVAIAQSTNLFTETASNKAALKISEEHIFYPEAYKVFSQWVIKLPPYIAQCGNDFLPPESLPIDQDGIRKLTQGMPLEEFRHDHVLARKKLTGLKSIELNR